MKDLPEPIKISARELAKQFAEAEANYIFIDIEKARDLYKRGYKIYKYIVSDAKAAYFRSIKRPVYRIMEELVAYFITVPLEILEKRD